MKNNKMKMSIVEESDKGLYVWIMPDGSIVADDQGNYFNIPAFKNDQVQINNLKDALKNEFGITEGKPVFMSGYRRVTDEEYQYQKQRLEWGLIPDELDIAAFQEEMEQNKIKEQRRNA